MAAPLRRFLGSNPDKNKMITNSVGGVGLRCFHVYTRTLSGKRKNFSDDRQRVFDDFVTQPLPKPSNAKEKYGKPNRQSLTTDDVRAFDPSKPGKRSPPFIQLMRERYREACQSVIVRTSNPESTVRALSSFGTLKFAECLSKDKQYLIAEFASESCVRKLQNSALFFFESKKFPMISRSLFDESRGFLSANKRNITIPPLSEENWHTEPSNLYPGLSSLDEELEALCRSRSLNDLDLRARFLACVLVEDLVRPILPEARILPYGSCFNGFGWWDSDLDMMLCLQGDPYVPGTIKKPQRSGFPTNFKFLTEVFSTERMLSQKTLAMVASIMEVAPRFNNIHKILNAHVPIVRYFSPALNLHCDVSIEAMDSIKMTELLFFYSILDQRVKPLMTGIKQWALSQGLTSSGEQQKPTTIGLLTLLVFYLQTRVPAVLPTFRVLQKAAAPSDIFYIDGVAYGIPTNPSILPKSENTESLESLLHGFFVFYSEFDFDSKAISIIEGSTFSKPADSSPLYMENPLCIGHNICKNVSKKNLEALTEAMKLAATKIESFSSSPSSGNEPESRVSSLFSGSTTKSRLSFLFSSSASNCDEEVKVEVSDLFDDGVLEEEEEGKDSGKAVGDNKTLASTDSSESGVKEELRNEEKSDIANSVSLGNSADVKSEGLGSQSHSAQFSGSGRDSSLPNEESSQSSSAEDKVYQGKR